MKFSISTISFLFLCVGTYPASIHGGSPRAAALDEDLTKRSRSLSSTTYGFKRIGMNIDGVKGSVSGADISLNSDGSRLAVGATRGGGNTRFGNNPKPEKRGEGIVKVYERGPDDEWFQLGLEIEGEIDNEKSGRSVSLSASGNRVAVGAPNNDEISIYRGQVRVYDYAAGSSHNVDGVSVNGEWTQYGQDLNGDGSYNVFGEMVRLSGDGMRLIVGAPDILANSFLNYARVFADIDGAWVQIGQDIDEATVNGAGNAIAISADGERVSVGEVFELVDSTWIQVGQDINGENGGYNWYSCEVDLNDDGTMIIVGESSANTINGDKSGQARIFQEVDGIWIQVGGAINGESLFNYWGRSVGISDDGSRVASVSSNNDGGGIQRGHLRVFDLVVNEWVQNGPDIDGEDDGDGFYSRVAVSADGSTVAVGYPENDGEGTVYAADGDDYDYYDVYQYYGGGHVRVFEQCTSFPCCEDSDNEYAGKNCAWVAQNPDRRCPMCADNYCADDYCRQTCGTC